MDADSTPSNCPKCGGTHVASILYGLPDFGAELERELDSGQVVLGGCCVFDDSPCWACRDCGHRWGELEFPDSNPPANTVSE